MDLNNLKGLVEAYAAVYDEDLREEYLEEDYSFIDDLYEEELEEVVEEVIYDLLDEGYDFEEVESLFEDTFLTEAVVTSDSDRKTGRGKVTTGTGSLKAAQNRLAKRKQEKRAERKEKIKSVAKGVLSNITKGIKRAAKKTMVGAEKAKQALSGVDRGAERAKRQQRARMVQTARKGIKKAVTGKANTTYRGAGVGRKETASSGSYTPPKKETPQGTKRSTIGNVSGPASSPKKPVAKVTRKDVTGSTGAGTAGTIRSRSSSGSGDGPSSTGRSLPPKGATARTPAGNLRRPSQVAFTLARAQKTGGKKLAANEDFEVWVEDLLNEGYDLSEYTWEELGDIYLSEAKKLRPASERMARTMTSADRKRQKRERELRDAGQQALADIRALSKAERDRSSVNNQSSSNRSTPDAEVRRIPKGQKVDRLAMQAKKAMGEEVEVFDVVLDFLFSEGYVETLEEAEWIMANEFDSEDIDAILEVYEIDEAKADAELTPLQKIRKRNKKYALPGEPAGQQTSNRRAERSSTRGVKKEKGAKSAFGTMRHIGGPYKDDNYSRYMGK